MDSVGRFGRQRSDSPHSCGWNRLPDVGLGFAHRLNVLSERKLRDPCGGRYDPSRFIFTSRRASLEMDLKPFIRDVPDFPKPGILFRDISPLLADTAAWRACAIR